MDIRHIDVYREPGKFAGWPANYGLWSWSDEIVAVFAVGEIGDMGELHEIDREEPFIPCQARSLDGGRTWKTEVFNGRLPGGPTLSADEHVVHALKTGPRIVPERDLGRLERPIDFLDSETVVLAARTGLASNAISWFYVSRDRARSWEGPYRFDGIDPPISARTDIVPLGRDDALFMLTTAKADGEEGRVFCARTRDGGRRFTFEGFVGDEPAGFSIMPASVLRPDGSILTLVRMGAPSAPGWIEAFTSDDRGKTWSAAGRVVENTGTGGNPPALASTTDGTLVLVYGYRDAPFGIRMRTSAEGGRSWSEEYIVRDDGGTPDLGYPRLVRLNDGTLLAVYYFNQGEGEERYIATSLISAA